ncbi:transposable element Tcb1 transposase [Trichonephila clavipes]|nr:transposable element Tcb1 transposase [Trichonephila clavipes]
MAGNTLPGLTSFVSNKIELTDVNAYGDNLMNPWTLHVNRGLIVQAGGGSVMVWVVCSWRDMGLPIRLDTTLTGDSRTMRHPHTSRVATEWLQEHSFEFRHFLWPPKSPDMNIIKHILDALQRAVQKRSPSSLTPSDLWIALQDSNAKLYPDSREFDIRGYPLVTPSA